MEDGTVEVQADLSWLELAERAPSTVAIRVRPDLTLEFDGLVDAVYRTGLDLRFVGRPGKRSRNCMWRNSENPLQFYAANPDEQTPLHRRMDELSRAVHRVAKNRWRWRIERLRRTWNGMLRRALDYADPFVLETVRRVDAH